MTRRVVLGCADPAVTGRVASVAAELGDELVRVATTSAETVDAVRTLAPDVLLVAESLGPMPVLDLVRQIGRTEPFTGVVLLASSPDQELYRVAMEAGARSVAPLAFTVDDLGERIANAADWGAALRAHVADTAAARNLGSGHVVTLAGSKGGVGVTTVAVHLALAYAASGRRACLLDLDLQAGDVAALLDITHRRDVVDLVPVVEEVTAQALDEVLYRHPSGLSVLLAPREGENGEQITEHVARAVLGSVKSRFDIVVVDAGSVLTPAGAIAVQMADQAVLVATPDVLSARGARRSVALWDRLQLRREGDASVLLNRVSRQVEVQPDLAAKLVRLPLLETSVPASFRKLEAATNTGDPARLVDREVRRAVGRLAAELGGGQSSPATAPVPVASPPAGPTGGRAPVPARGPGTVPVPVAAVAAPGRASALPWRRRGDRGQTAVEFLGMFPLLLLTVFLLVQGGLVGLSHVVAGHAAARGARVAVSPEADYDAIRAAAVDALPSAWRDGAQVTVNGSPGFGGGDPRLGDPNVAVSVAAVTPALFPLVGEMFGLDGRTVRSSAQMRFEG